ncbi:uncharacterized protein MONBRDRAFT_30993 [Monosiga brevicollis MX1]|uniref:non-specific serine/threonine protein kinase n=1 Tax=Monosiga brevicollis TaxID=81824 RepID=A9UQM5_MONBE|nr:uncharacterized protein MONBRDRAFT_30993 [Monosiga brevicollis MX1]EDQ92625.1 predicted protein [Monosiga brevicollis MX1]|eukprot:XP_001742387.1 hypothetical protein [Monosiga brevicollis MX1]
MSGTGVTRIGQYVLGSTIGKGSFGKVKRAEHAITGHVVAIKIINRDKVKSQDMLDKIKREIQILKLFRHPHIIRLYQVVTSPSDIFMIMEHVSGGELFNYILRRRLLPEDEARRFFQQIISGVDYCHRHMVVHRDLKPENLLLDENLNVKIADFGLSNVMTDGEFLRTSCGSPNYASPQVISGLLYAGPEVDVWSCGVILYVLICGKLPFDDDHLPTLFRKIRKGVFQIPSHMSEGARDLVTQMLNVDPIKRITIDKIREHPWFLIDLPPKLFEHCNIDESSFDKGIVEEICKRFRVYEDHVLDALHSNDPSNQLVIAYKLIADNNRRHAPAIVVNHLTMPCADPSHPIMVRERKKSLIVPMPSGHAWAGRKIVKRSRWHLGMRSRNRPAEIMGEVYRSLEALNLQWKVITPYHLRCRCWNQVSGTMMKMSLQLFQSDDQQYLLDFNNLATSEQDRLHALDEDVPQTDTVGFHTLEFFELCAMVIAELGR